jgi:hypothetical protein
MKKKKQFFGMDMHAVHMDETALQNVQSDM